MAKPRRSKQDVASATVTEPFNAGLAGLASLRDKLPQGEPLDTPAEAAPACESVAPAKVVVRRERKGRKGKTVTRITGFTAGAPEWARRMKRELGCGGSVEEQDIVLTGDIGDRVVRWLEAAGIARVVRGS